jgi:hypothetical protein
MVFKFSFSDEVTEINSIREYFISDFDIGHLSQTELLYMERSVFIMSTHSPIFILTIQFPLRFILKYIFNRKPVIDDPFPTIVDQGYTMLLVSGVFLAMFLS